MGRASLLRRFVKLSGGRRSRLVVVPTASSFQDEVVDAYTQVFTRLGAAAPGVVNPTSRQEAHDPELVALIDQATGVFFSGAASSNCRSTSPAPRSATQSTVPTPAGPSSAGRRRGPPS